MYLKSWQEKNGIHDPLSQLPKILSLLFRACLLEERGGSVVCSQKKQVFIRDTFLNVAIQKIKRTVSTMIYSYVITTRRNLLALYAALCWTPLV